MSDDPGEILEPLQGATSAAQAASASLHASVVIGALTDSAIPMPTKGAVMAEPVSTAATAAATAASGATLTKLGAGGLAVVLLLAGVGANVAAFLFFWPKTAREAFSRVVLTMMGSALGGPLLWVVTMARWPELFDAARNVAGQLGLPEVYGMAVLAVNLACIAGMPFWWLVGAVLLFFDRRRGKDIVEIAKDAKEVLP